MRIKRYEYDINDFIYDAETSTLIANEEDLYHSERKFLFNFPNKRKKFYIFNKLSGNFRRFKLKYEKKDFYLFVTEDEKPIRCLVKKLIFTW